MNATGQNEAPMSAEDQATAIEAQRLHALQNNDPISKILPLTPHTQEILDSFQQAPQ
jgi:hypothetical protein